MTSLSRVERSSIHPMALKFADFDFLNVFTPKSSADKNENNEKKFDFQNFLISLKVGEDKSGNVRPKPWRFLRPIEKKPKFKKITANLSALNDELERTWATFYDNTRNTKLLDDISRILSQITTEIQVVVSNMEEKSNSEMKQAVLKHTEDFAENANLSRQQLEYWREQLRSQANTIRNYLQEADRICQTVDSTSDLSKMAAQLNERIQQWATELALFKLSRESFLDPAQLANLSAASARVEAAQATVAAILESQAKMSKVPSRRLTRTLTRTTSLSGLNKAALDSIVDAYKTLPGGSVPLPEQVVRAGSDDVPLQEPLTAYMELKIMGDGRCLFRAVTRGRALNAGFDMSQSLATMEADAARKLVVQSMLKQGQSFVDTCFLEESLESYCRKMSDPGAYGGEPELLVLTGVLEAPIYVYLKSADSYVLIQQYGGFYAQAPVRILYNGRDHYNLLATAACLAKAKGHVVSDPSIAAASCSLM
uniref:Ubiquitin thioesterase OTU n=1 Tax=Cyanoptyche gloeocystis TaxID=77922 RepID=A0A7S2JLA6_9EUKA